MKRVYEIGLMSGVTLAALAFGGTERPYISVVQIALLGLGVLFLATYKAAPAANRKFPITIPLLLVLIVIVQWVHLPSPSGTLSGNIRYPLDGAMLIRISIAPYETLSHLLLLVTYLAAFYLTLVVCWRNQGGRRLVFALLGLGTFEVCYGLFQYLTGWQQIFSYTKTTNVEMATGTYINYDHFAGLLEMILPFALACAYDQFQNILPPHAHPKRRLRSLFARVEAQKLVLWLFLAAIFFVAIVFSESRMGLVSAIVSAFLIVILIVTSGWQKRSAGILLLAFLAAGMSLAAWIGPEPVIARFEALGQQNTTPAENRWAIWKDTLRLTEAHPWLGTGLGTFSAAYPSVQTAFAGRFVTHAHNDYLEFASEIGIPGALLLFGAVFYLMTQSARSFRQNVSRIERTIALGTFGSLLGISLHSLTDFNLQIPANALVFAVVLGLAYANSSRTHSVALAPIVVSQP
jgi:O-antigen ligase